MFCINCGNKLNNDDKFCANCGANVTTGIVPNQTNLNNGVVPPNNTPKKKSNTGLIITLVVIFVILVVGWNVGKLFVNVYKGVTDIIEEVESSVEENKSEVKGKYTRNPLSGHKLECVEGTTTATFVLNNDSTFNVTFSNGNSYVGTYELYNGVFITLTKYSEIKNDTSIANNEELAEDIYEVADKMMSDTKYILNTYLLWFKTDSGILQPYVLNYDEDTKSGDIVNIYARTQGTYKLN